MNLAETQAAFWAALRGEPHDASSFQGRPAVYEEMYLWRQIDALEADFPRLAEHLGHDAFHALAKRYIAAHPSEHPDLGRLGARLPAFCNEPLAALDWARTEAFTAADAEPVTVAALKGAASFEERRLRFVPSLQLLGAHVVWRIGFDVYDAEVAPQEAAALRRAQAGAPLAEVCAAFDDAREAFDAIGSWFAEGMIAAVV